MLEDFSNLDSKKQNRAAGAADKPVPAALFEKLNSKFRFPKGALFYHVPDEGSYRILRTTEPTEWYEWLRFAAMAGIAVGMAVASMGASIPATVAMVASSAAFAVADGAEMQDKASHGMLTKHDIALHTASMLACVTAAAGASMKLGMAARNALEGIEGFTGVQQSVIRVVAGVQLGADTPCLALFTHEALASLQEAAAQDPEGKDAFPRLLSFLFQMGMQGVMLVGMRHSMVEIGGGEEFSPRKAAPTEPKPHAEESVAFENSGSSASIGREPSKAASSKSQKVALNSTDLSRIALEFRIKNNLWHEGNVVVFEYVDLEGNMQHLVEETTKESGRHSERIAIERLQQMGIPAKNVKRIYSELEPCELEGGGKGKGGCKRMIKNEIGDGVEITYSYQYPGSDKSTRHLRQEGLDQRRLDFTNFKNTKE